jgi:hypothetical protein
MRLCRYDDSRIAWRDRNVRRIGNLELCRRCVPGCSAVTLNSIAARAWMEHLPTALPHVRSSRFRLRARSPARQRSSARRELPHHGRRARRDAEIAVYNAGRQRTVEQQGLFLKASSSLVGPSEGVTVRFPDRRTDHEAELGVVIGRKTGPVAEADALGVVAGYAIALDMVVRGQEDRSYRKSPDSYAVLGPWLVTADEVGDPSALDFSLHVNGEIRQTAHKQEMIIYHAPQI